MTKYAILVLLLLSACADMTPEGTRDVLSSLGQSRYYQPGGPMIDLGPVRCRSGWGRAYRVGGEVQTQCPQY